MFLIHLLNQQLVKQPNLINFNLILFWPHHTACGILVLQPGINPTLPALAAQSLNHWAARKASFYSNFNSVKIIHAHIFESQIVLQNL